jgi:hypothetical protein
LKPGTANSRSPENHATLSPDAEKRLHGEGSWQRPNKREWIVSNPSRRVPEDDRTLLSFPCQRGYTAASTRTKGREETGRARRAMPKPALGAFCAADYDE